MFRGVARREEVGRLASTGYKSPGTADTMLSNGERRQATLDLAGADIRCVL